METDDGQEEEIEFLEAEQCLMILRGSQAYEKEVNVVDTIVAQTWLRWSEMAITFDRDDHRDHVPHPGAGSYPLVVSPIVGTTRLSKVLMNGGSCLNFLYAETLDKIKIPRRSLLPSKAPFYGVIRGKQAVPLGRIRLHVTSRPPFGPLVQAFSSALHCSRSIAPRLRI